MLIHHCGSYDAGYRKITYKGLANAINGAAWWLHQTLGPGHNFETLAYIGPNDFRYNVFILGAVKAGYKVCDYSLILLNFLLMKYRYSRHHLGTVLQPIHIFSKL